MKKGLVEACKHYFSFGWELHEEDWQFDTLSLATNYVLTLWGV
jgi:hypothetical protein